MAEVWRGSPKERELTDEIMKKWEESRSAHQSFINAYERRERSYRGVLQTASTAARWRHKLHPPYAFNLLETVVSNMVEMGLKFEWRPSPHANLSYDEAVSMLQQTEVVSDLIEHEHRIDDMDSKQRPLFLTAAIGGRGVGKCSWNWQSGSVKKQGVVMEPIHDDDGNVVFEAPVMSEIETEDVIRDHSTFEVVDPRDFVVHESARTLNPYEPGGAQHVFHRVWYSYEQLLMMERAGYMKNVKYLKESRGSENEINDRESEVWGLNRSKDLIPCLEYWCMKEGKVHRSIVGSDQAVLLQDETDNPFWHGGYPFIVSSPMSQPFTTIGMSEIELIEQLQEMLWEIMNQRLDTLELVTNAIMLVRSDLDEDLPWYPGAQWPVEDPAQVARLEPPYQSAEISLQAEALLKGDLQNVTSAAPFASGAETATVDQKTATGASIVMNAAQQRLISKKYQAQFGLKDEANMRLKNCQQFISGQRLAHVVGPDGAMRFREIDIAQIQGEFMGELTAMGDSQMRQEKRAEASQLMQILVNIAPMAAAAGTPMNIKEVIAWGMKRWEIHDWERFFSVQPAASGAVAGLSGAGGGGGEPAPPGGEANMGITSDTAVDAGSPSATGGLSMNPASMLSRALAMGGGGGGVA